MPWKVQTSMSGRRQFVDEYIRRTVSMTELCERYGISRLTGYKWVDRADEGGRTALADRSRAPNVCWIRLGIQQQRILPAHPQQYGAHERMAATTSI